MFVATVRRALVGCLVGAITAAAQVRGAEPAPTMPVSPWPATDHLGRSLPPAGAVPAPRPGRFVGMFYFLWHDNRGGRRPEGDGPFDVAKILAADPDALKKPTSPPWGPSRPRRSPTSAPGSAPPTRS